MSHASQGHRQMRLGSGPILPADKIGIVVAKADGEQILIL